MKVLNLMISECLGEGRISKSGRRELHDLLLVRLKEDCKKLVSDAQRVSRHAGRKTVKSSDIKIGIGGMK